MCQRITVSDVRVAGVAQTFPMTEQMTDRLRLTAEDLDAVRANPDWQALFAGLGLHKAERKSKPDDWWAFSPFHDETTPSFHMGQGASGMIFRLAKAVAVLS